jgi:hypothetical protein
VADSTVTIGGDISDLQTKLKQAGAGVKSFGNQARTSLSGIDLGKVLGTAGGIAGLTSLVKIGFDFNQTMKDGEVAIANVLRTFKGLNGEAAKSEAARVVQLIAEAEPKAAGGLKELTQGFIASAAAASSAGISVEENVDLVARFANALANSGLPLDQLNQEIRSVLTANITSDSFVGKLLEGKGLNNARIKQLAEEGKLYGELVKELGALGENGDTAAVAFSTLDSAMKKVLGAMTSGLFEEAVGGAKDLSTYLNENKELFMDIGSGIGMAAKELVKFLGFLNEARKITQEVIGVKQLLGVLDARNAGAEAAALSLPGVRQARDAAQNATQPKAAAPSGIPSAVDASATAAPAAKSLLSITREIEAVEKMREKIGERQFATLLRHLTPQLQIEGIEKRITAEKEKQQSQLDVGPRSESTELANMEVMLDLQEQLARAKQASAEAAAAATEKEAAATARLLDQAQSLADIQAQTEILKAQAAGDDKKAAALQRQAEIQRAVKDIVDATGVSEAEALRLAEEQQKLKEQIAANQNEGRDKDGRGRIDASIGEGGVDGARKRAEERLKNSRDRSSAAVEGAFGTFKGEDARLKEKFGREFGPPGAERQNPASVQAAANVNATPGADAGGTAAAAAQIVIQNLPQLVSILSGS